MRAVTRPWVCKNHIPNSPERAQQSPPAGVAVARRGMQRRRDRRPAAARFGIRSGRGWSWFANRCLLGPPFVAPFQGFALILPSGTQGCATAAERGASQSRMVRSFVAPAVAGVLSLLGRWADMFCPFGADDSQQLRQPMCVVFHDPVDQSVMRVGRLG